MWCRLKLTTSVRKHSFGLTDSQNTNNRREACGDKFRLRAFLLQSMKFHRAAFER